MQTGENISQTKIIPLNLRTQFLFLWLLVSFLLLGICFLFVFVFNVLTKNTLALTRGRPQYHDLTRCVKPPKCERSPSK